MRIVVRDKPVARSTAAIPPSPIASASAAAHSRLIRSSITGFSASYFSWISVSLAIPTVDHTLPVHVDLIARVVCAQALSVRDKGLEDGGLASACPPSHPHF